MTRFVKIFLAFTLAIFAILFSAYTLFYLSKYRKTFTLDRLELRNGDLIFRRGRSVESFAVFLFDKNRDYSHIGIIVHDKGEPQVVHIVPGSPGLVKKERPNDFLNHSIASHFAVYRPIFPDRNLDTTASEALKFYHEHLVFDNFYDMDSDSALYCSELVIKAFRNSNIEINDIFPQNLNLITGTYKVFLPGAFLKSSHFTCIIAE